VLWEGAIGKSGSEFAIPRNLNLTFPIYKVRRLTIPPASQRGYSERKALKAVVLPSFTNEHPSGQCGLKTDAPKGAWVAPRPVYF